MKKKQYFLTIDVGIKNLAICICSYDDNINDNNLLEKINIIEWDILDVSYKPLYCLHIKNKRAICNCISKYYTLKPETSDHTEPLNLIGYCKSHTKIAREFNKKKENKKNQIKLYPISSNPIYKNNFNTQMEKLLVELNKFFNKKIMSPYAVIDNKLLFINNLQIYIENQPVFKNPIMKSISVGLYTFFLMKKVEYPKIIKSVNFINATVKTKKDFIEKLEKIINITSNINKFDTYENRKNFSEEIVNKIIQKLSFKPEFINNIISISNYIIRKKKDDMADTLLYVIYIILYLL
jgi:hypothetical protein